MGEVGTNTEVTGSRIDVKREIVMMQVMNTITDKPDWDKKVMSGGMPPTSFNHLITNAACRPLMKKLSRNGAKKSLEAAQISLPR